jgi:hypothetical protein
VNLQQIAIISLSPRASQVLSHLVANGRRDGDVLIAQLSQNEIARALQCTTRTVRRSLQELQMGHFATIQPGTGHCRTTFVIHQGGQKCPPRVDTNVRPGRTNLSTPSQDSIEVSEKEHNPNEPTYETLAVARLIQIRPGWLHPRSRWLSPSEQIEIINLNTKLDVFQRVMERARAVCGQLKDPRAYIMKCLREPNEVLLYKRQERTACTHTHR